MDILLHAFAALLYAALSLHFWRTRWLGAAPAPIANWERALILAPLALQSWLLWQNLFGSAELRFGFAIALSTMLWLAVLIYWIENLFLKIEGMLAPVLGLAALCTPWPVFFPGLAAPPAAQSMEFRSHAALAMLAYSLFTLAALHALLMTMVERRLHGRASGTSMKGPWASLPPLLSMETLLFRLIASGFVLLTLTLASGAIYSETIFGQAMRFNHKTLFAIISWLIFAALLCGRYLYGWRGRQALRWTLSGFAVLLLAYIGSRFVVEVILRRSLA
ncbi:MAG: inner membrane protein YpjD [Burkholderiales bacterium]